MPTKTKTSSTAVAAPKKVVAKKAALKKTTVKKASAAPVKKASAKTGKTTKTAMKSAGLVCASDEHCFWTTDGSVLKSLEELVFAFGSMDETVFVYHADGQKNDFAEWVEHVLQDAACAKELRRADSPKTAHKVAKKHLKKYA